METSMFVFVQRRPLTLPSLEPLASLVHSARRQRIPVMATISTSPSWERLLLSNGDRQDLKKTTRTIWWENRKVSPMCMRQKRHKFDSTDVKDTLHQCVALCVLIYTCSFFTGYEMFVSSSLINYRSFIERFGIEFHGRKEISVSLQQGMRLWFNLGAFLSNCLQWYVAENYLGRVRLAQCGLVCAIFSTILQIVAPDRTCFMFGRFFMGISDAVIRYGIFLWVTESAIAPIVRPPEGMRKIGKRADMSLRRASELPRRPSSESNHRLAD